LNQDGFASFFHQRYSGTVVLLVTMGASRADAEDIAQETMIAAWQKWESIREPAAWVRTIAARKLWKINRQQLTAAQLDEGIAQPAASEPDLAVFSEEQQRVLSLLRQLPAAQRVITALYYDGLTAEEIAAATGRPAATVRSHLRHARKTLKEVIASDRSLSAAPEL
jgi:RNA polymerase sigma factor (sigma-70 family)